MALSLDKLVDAKAGTVSRELFVSQELFDLEQEHLFSRAWLLVGHESMVPNPDDYFVSRMGTDSVILTRDRQNQIQVLLNSCAHRGMRLCRQDQGNTRAFACPYHGWTFTTDGKLSSTPGALTGVPGMNKHYYGELDKSAWGLRRVAKLVNFKGTIWATWDPNAPEFDEYLGDMKLYLDYALDHRDGSPGGSEVFAGVQKMVGITRTKDVVMRSRRVPGTQACEWGVATECVADAELEAATDRLAEELLTFSPLAQRTAKKLLNDTEDAPLSVAIELEGHCYSRLRSSDDFREGVQAFHAKRPPVFRGS